MGRGVLVAAVAAVAAASMLVGGCAKIPTDGPVTLGRDGPADTTDLRVIPNPPAFGAAPEEVVRGFLLAAGGTDDDYSVARSFLTAVRAPQWSPDAGTVVYSGESPVLTVLNGGRALDAGGPVGPDVTEVVVRARLNVVATIDDRGRYATAPTGTSHESEFRLVRDDEGQWRIGDLEDGVLISDSYLRLVYRSYRLYFLDPSSRVLVPEMRWFSQRDSNATTLARELLAGPSPWLAGAVRTSFPAGTRLAAPSSVPIEDGVARVDLSGQARRASPPERALMLAQMEATLLPVRNVAEVTITVGGGEIDIPPLAPSPVLDPAVDPEPVLVQGGTLVRLGSDNRLSPVAGLPDLTGLGISHPGLSYQQTYAVLAAQRSQLLLVGGKQGTDVPPKPVLVGADLTAPSFDRFGWVWSTPAASTGTVSAVSPQGDVVQVPAPWLQGRRVTSLRVSRDGTRVVVVSTDSGGRGHVEVAGVVRSSDRAPTSLSASGPVDAGVMLVRADEAVWLDDDEVAVLGRAGDDPENRVYVLTIGGQGSAPLPSSPAAIVLAAGTGEHTILLGTGSGAVLEQTGAVWVPIPGTEGARDPAFVG